MTISSAVNGTDERLDVLIALFEQLVAELRVANALPRQSELPAAPAATAKKKK